eukprot:5425997-Lingulodinium_polyedra.AAC.1
MQHVARAWMLAQAKHGHMVQSKNGHGCNQQINIHGRNCNRLAVRMGTKSGVFVFARDTPENL